MTESRYYVARIAGTSFFGVIRLDEWRPITLDEAKALADVDEAKSQFPSVPGFGEYLVGPEGELLFPLTSLGEMSARHILKQLDRAHAGDNAANFVDLSLVVEAAEDAEVEDSARLQSLTQLYMKVVLEDDSVASAGERYRPGDRISLGCEEAEKGSLFETALACVGIDEKFYYQKATVILPEGSFCPMVVRMDATGEVVALPKHQFYVVRVKC